MLCLKSLGVILRGIWRGVRRRRRIRPPGTYMGAANGVADGTLWDGYIAMRSKIRYFMGC